MSQISWETINSGAESEPQIEKHSSNTAISLRTDAEDNRIRTSYRDALQSLHAWMSRSNGVMPENSEEALVLAKFEQVLECGSSDIENQSNSEGIRAAGIAAIQILACKGIYKLLCGSNLIHYQEKALLALIKEFQFVRLAANVSWHFRTAYQLKRLGDYWGSRMIVSASQTHDMSRVFNVLETSLLSQHKPSCAVGHIPKLLTPSALDLNTTVISKYLSLLRDCAILRRANDEESDAAQFQPESEEIRSSLYEAPTSHVIDTLSGTTSLISAPIGGDDEKRILRRLPRGYSKDNQSTKDSTFASRDMFIDALDRLVTAMFEATISVPKRSDEATAFDPFELENEFLLKHWNRSTILPRYVLESKEQLCHDMKDNSFSERFRNIANSLSQKAFFQWSHLHHSSVPVVLRICKISQECGSIIQLLSNEDQVMIAEDLMHDFLRDRLYRNGDNESTGNQGTIYSRSAGFSDMIEILSAIFEVWSRHGARQVDRIGWRQNYIITSLSLWVHAEGVWLDHSFVKSHVFEDSHLTNRTVSSTSTLYPFFGDLSPEKCSQLGLIISKCNELMALSISAQNWLDRIFIFFDFLRGQDDSSCFDGIIYHVAVRYSSSLDTIFHRAMCNITAIKSASLSIKYFIYFQQLYTSSFWCSSIKVSDLNSGIRNIAHTCFLLLAEKLYTLIPLVLDLGHTSESLNVGDMQDTRPQHSNTDLVDCIRDSFHCFLSLLGTNVSLFDSFAATILDISTYSCYSQALVSFMLNFCLYQLSLSENGVDPIVRESVRSCMLKVAEHCISCPIVFETPLMAHYGNILSIVCKRQDLNAVPSPVSSDQEKYISDISLIMQGLFLIMISRMKAPVVRKRCDPFSFVIKRLCESSILARDGTTILRELSLVLISEVLRSFNEDSGRSTSNIREIKDALLCLGEVAFIVFGIPLVPSTCPALDGLQFESIRELKSWYAVVKMFSDLNLCPRQTIKSTLLVLYNMLWIHTSLSFGSNLAVADESSIRAFLLSSDYSSDAFCLFLNRNIDLVNLPSVIQMNVYAEIALHIVELGGFVNLQPEDSIIIISNRERLHSSLMVCCRCISWNSLNYELLGKCVDTLLSLFRETSDRIGDLMFQDQLPEPFHDSCVTSYDLERFVFDTNFLSPGCSPVTSSNLEGLVVSLGEKRDYIINTLASSMMRTRDDFPEFLVHEVIELLTYKDHLCELLKRVLVLVNHIETLMSFNEMNKLVATRSLDLTLYYYSLAQQHRKGSLRRQQYFERALSASCVNNQDDPNILIMSGKLAWITDKANTESPLANVKKALDIVNCDNNRKKYGKFFLNNAKYQYHSIQLKANIRLVIQTCNSIVCRNGHDDNDKLRLKTRDAWDAICSSFIQLREISRGNLFDFYATYRLSDALFLLAKFSIPLDGKFKKLLLDEYVKYENLLELSQRELASLFEKKRPGVVNIWCHPNQNCFDLMLSKATKFNNMRQKYVRRYLQLSVLNRNLKGPTDVISYALMNRRSMDHVSLWIVDCACQALSSITLNFLDNPSSEVSCDVELFGYLVDLGGNVLAALKHHHTKTDFKITLDLAHSIHEQWKQSSLGSSVNTLVIRDVSIDNTDGEVVDFLTEDRPDEFTAKRVKLSE